jgi:hypothetical protein
MRLDKTYKRDDPLVSKQTLPPGRFETLLHTRQFKVPFPFSLFVIYLVSFCYFMSVSLFVLAQLLGRTVDMASLFTERLNKILRANINYALERFEAADLRRIVVRSFVAVFSCFTSVCRLYMFLCIVSCWVFVDI